MGIRPFPAAETERVEVFRAQIREARRVGITDPAAILRNVCSHWRIAGEDFAKHWAARRAPLHLRSSDWTPAYVAQWGKTDADTVRCDSEDRRQHVERQAAERRYVREALSELRWCRWMAAHLQKPDTVRDIVEDCRIYLRWRKDGRYSEAAVLNAAGQVVAEVLHQGGRGPTFKAVIYDKPFLCDGGAPLYANESEIERPARPVLTWALLRQRKQAAAWVVDNLHRKAGALFEGADLDIPEYVK